MWWWFFNSWIVRTLPSCIKMFHALYVIGAMLVLLFLDSLRENIKYSAATINSYYDTPEQELIRMYRTQRNMYMSGFALFLIPVARHLKQCVGSRQPEGVVQ